MSLAPWHQYAHDAVHYGTIEAGVQEKLRPILLRIRSLEKDREQHADQIAALQRKAEVHRASLRELPMRVGKYVRLACERHLRDLENGHERGLFFSEKVAGAAVKFYSFLTHNKGKWAGQPLTLEPWQQFIIASVFGWKRADGTRRFRESYTEVARKNGKSTFSSGVGLQLLVADGEAGAEIYTAATKKEQARIVFGDAQNMARKSTALARSIKVQQHSIFAPATLSKMVPMSADAKTEDGLNPHGIIIDEYHAHPNDELYGVLKSATGARTQPLLTIITTAGFNKLGPCAQLRKSCVSILEGVFEADHYFAIIFSLDEELDDWNDESCWVKANPNLGVSVGLAYLREQYLDAVRTPSLQVNFKTKHLNLWTDSAETWLPAELWALGATAVPVEELAGRSCYGGLDLASVRDICALELLFPNPDGSFETLHFYWIPADTVEERTKKDGVPYRQWVEQGLMFATPGNVTDYNFIKAHVLEFCELYQVQRIGYDRYNSSQLVIDLTAEGIAMSPFGQGFISMGSPTKELERLVLEGMIHHGGNEVLSWMNGNVVLQRDAAGNIKIDKGKAKDKVDGMVALVMALGEYMTDVKEGPSKYEEEDLVFL
ncbi:terminase large subunit [Hymenobacter sp. HD11105]